MKVEVLVLGPFLPTWRWAVADSGRIQVFTTAGDGLMGQVGDTQKPADVIAGVADLLGISADDVAKAADTLREHQEHHESH